MGSRRRAGLAFGVWMVFVFLVAVFGVLLNVPVVWGSGTIYIKADGSIDPSTAPIRREGNLYTFLDNINEPIVVERDNVIIDGAGYKLQGTETSDSKGIKMNGRSNVVIQNLEISAFAYGIYLDHSQNTRIIENNITNGATNSRGIFLDGSSNNAILRNNITKNSVGIQTFSSSGNNNIFENNITDNTYGLYLGSSNIIVGNNIMRNEHWSGDGCGVHLGGGSDNIFFHNNLIDNFKQADSSSPNVWDDGYPSGGNYWSDFEERYPSAEDVYSGPYQNQTGSDGIWDESYGIQYLSLGGPGQADLWIESGYRDNYPFVNPCAPSTYHELVVFISTTPDWTPLGDLFSVNATVTNLGSTDESNVELLLLINSTVAKSTTIPLLKVDSSYTLNYPWIPALKGEYNITAYAPPVLGERWLESNRETRFMFARARVRIGVKVGDWIKYDYAAANAPSGTAIPEWMKVEILAIEGTNITLRSTMHLSDEKEDSETLTLNFAGYYNYYPRGTLDTLFGCCFIIAANRTVGELSINTVVVPTNYDVTLSMNLKEETIRTCAEVSRTVVFSQWPGYLGGRYGSQPLKYYWDKQTGILVEASVTIDGVPITAKAIETNMWQAQPSGLPFDQTYLYILAAAIIVVAVGSVAFVMRRKKKPPDVVTPTAPTF